MLVVVFIDTGREAGGSSGSVVGGVATHRIGIVAPVTLVTHSTEAVVPFIVFTVSAGGAGKTITVAEIAVHAHAQIGKERLLPVVTVAERNIETNIQAIVFFSPFVVTAL